MIMTIESKKKRICDMDKLVAYIVNVIGGDCDICPCSKYPENGEWLCSKTFEQSCEEMIKNDLINNNVVEEII